MTSFRIRAIWVQAMFITFGILMGWSANELVHSYPDYIEHASGSAPERNSPNNWISEDQITVNENGVTIALKDAMWSKFTNTNSMDPVLDDQANAIQIKPSKSDLKVGDIISYKTSDKIIIHRIVEIGDDGEWYSIAKGDNNSQNDPEKIRFDQIERVLVAVIY